MDLSTFTRTRGIYTSTVFSRRLRLVKLTSYLRYSLPFGSTTGNDLELPLNSTVSTALDFIETYPVYHGPQKRAGLSGILGSLTCPSTTSQNTDYSKELEDDDSNLDPDDVSSEMLKRSLEVGSSSFDTSFEPGE